MKPRCTARKSDGTECRRYPVHGARVCRSHGGAAPQVKAKAAARFADEQFERTMRRELVRLDVAPVDDPLTLLSALAGQAVAFKDSLADRVNGLHAIRYEDDKGSEQLRSEVALWERALDRCERFCTSMAKLNIEERLAHVSEQQANLVSEALAAVLREMGLSTDQQREARARVASHLRVAAS